MFLRKLSLGHSVSLMSNIMSHAPRASRACPPQSCLPFGSAPAIAAVAVATAFAAAAAAATGAAAAAIVTNATVDKMHVQTHSNLVSRHDITNKSYMGCAVPHHAPSSAALLNFGVHTRVSRER